MINYKKANTFLLLKFRYLYFDLIEEVAIELFEEENIKVNFKDISYRSRDERYVIKICDIYKKDEEKFLDIMEKLRRKIILDDNEYINFCITILSILQQ